MSFSCCRSPCPASADLNWLYLREPAIWPSAGHTSPLWASVSPLVKGEGIACGLWHPLIFHRELSIPLGRDSKWPFLLYTVRSLNPSMWVLRAAVCFCLDGFLCKIWILLGTINISSAFAGHCVSFCRAPHLLQGYFPAIIFWPRAL